jgi:hypothetical protein
MVGVPSTVVDRWLSRDFELIGAVANIGSGLVDLWEASPVRLNSNEPNTDKIIDLLSRQPSALLWLVASSFRHAHTGELVQAAKPTVHCAKSDDS